jgi:hypothetical protein
MMITTPSQRVQQVAYLVQRLNRDEIRQLIRLVPQLRDEPRGIPEEGAESDELVLWVREQMAPYAAETHATRDDDPFLGGMTVGEYFALPDQERERIWGELYVEAIESAPEREVNPNAVVPARQKHRSGDR